MFTEKNQDIIHAAIELFIREGFHETQMNTIASVARVSKRTLYRYYGSKEEVYFDVLQHFMRDLKSFYKVDYHPDRDFFEELERHIRGKIAYVLHPEFLKFSRLLMQEQMRGHNPVAYVAAEAQSIRNLFAQWIEENIRDGKFASTLPVSVLANFYHQSIEGMIFWPVIMGSRKGFTEEEINYIVTVIMNSFRHEVHTQKRNYQ